ncbi:MAG TPA: DNA polymerase III subunit delta [Gemmatimonadaceae bacterium]
MPSLREALNSKKFSPAYYFFGEDEYQKDEALRRMVEAAVDPATKDFNLDQRRGNELDAAGVSSLVGLPPMMAERRVVVIRDVTGLKKDARAALERYLDNPSAETLVIMTAPAEAKDDKGLSSRAEAIEFRQLNDGQIEKWIQSRASDLGASITPDAAALLQEAVGSDTAQIAVELSKLVAYSGGKTIDGSAVSAIVGVRAEETLSRLLDAVADRDVSLALSLISPVLMHAKTSAVYIVMALTTQMLALSAAQSRGVTKARLAGEYWALLKSGGSNLVGRPWGEAVSAWTKYSDKWSGPDLDHALAALLQADLALKGSKVSSEEQVLATALLTVCAGVRANAA